MHVLRNFDKKNEIVFKKYMSYTECSTVVLSCLWTFSILRIRATATTAIYTGI